jgi:O-methyltransferase involved in polyketide biosynthesis
LTYYLAAADVRSLLSQTADIAPEGSQLGVDFATTQALSLRWRVALTATRLWHRWAGEPLRFELHPNNAPAMLAESGWNASQILTHGDLYANFLRGTHLHRPPAVGSYVCKAAR